MVRVGSAFGMIDVAGDNPQLALEPTSNFFDTSGLPLRGLLVPRLTDRLLVFTLP